MRKHQQYWDGFGPYTASERERRQADWSCAIVMLTGLIGRDGFKDATPEVVSAFQTIISFAGDDIRKTQ